MVACFDAECDCGELIALPAQGEKTCPRCGAHFEVELRYTPARKVPA